MSLTGLRKNRSANTSYQHECQDHIALWSIRILINLNTWKSFRIHHNDECLRVIGLSEEQCDNLDKTELFKLLKKTKSKLDKREACRDSRAESNLRWIQQLVGLTDTEVEILCFAICISTFKPLDSVASVLGDLTRSGMCTVLSVILNISNSEISQALSSKGNLLTSGLLKIEKGNNTDLESLMQVPDGISELLSVREGERQSLLDQFFYQSKKPSLKLKDYPHAKHDIRLLKQYLATAIKKKAIGVNILLYGEPGTGKTELVGALAKSLRTDLYQISIADSDGDDLPGCRRLSAYQMVQRILSKQTGSLLLFDEIEDVFPETSIFSKNSGPGKAWFNNLLETNETPTFWLSNNIHQIDNAYIRRFDYVFELKTPPKSVRKNILHNNLSGLAVSEEWIEKISNDKQLVPAIISRASKVVNSISNEYGVVAEECMEQVLKNTMCAMGNKVQIRLSKSAQLDYDIDALNSSHNIQKLMEGLQTVSGARLCMYGPPGTGKTEFGHHISLTLDKPLIVKRASDILSPYVGVAEKNMADMFEQARDDGAVLLLDEADSFLQERTTLKQSWEITQVNEFLTQMESFDGLFICSTNLVDKLDAAALRRFDFKIKLDYLKIEQVWRLFCSALSWNKRQAKSNLKWQSKLLAYSNLTPGDFANVLRQHRLMTKNLTPEELFNGLKQESLFKKDSNDHREIGFHAVH